jgi:hypothetical protein
MKIAIIAGHAGRLLREPGHVVYVVANDSLPAQTDDHRERAHIHEGVDDQVNNESNVAPNVVGNQRQ